MNPTLQQLQNEVADSLRGLDSAQTQTVPPGQPDKWSIQQIAQHLCLTYTSTEAAIHGRLIKGRPTRAKPTMLQWIAQYFVTVFGYFPHGREAPSAVVPPSGGERLSGEDLSRAAAECLARIDKLFDQAEALFGQRRCITHEVLGPLSIHQWRRFHLVHGRHHIRQILGLRASRNL
ncbi:MAG: hypothetical protein JWQ42_1384 [Edaphobacter sp.]|nr:hypothetical protein [Edaphobacter sp.]